MGASAPFINYAENSQGRSADSIGRLGAHAHGPWCNGLGIKHKTQAKKILGPDVGLLFCVLGRARDGALKSVPGRACLRLC